jgi:hypothetical protein
LLDADLVDKVTNEIEYLDEMIKGEAQNIQKLNKKAKQYFRLDFVKNDVEKERKMVAIESEVARLKTSITKFTEKSLQN